MRHLLERYFGPFIIKELVQLSRRWQTYVTRMIIGFAILLGLMLVWQPWKVGYFAAKDLTLRQLSRLGYESVVAVGGVLWGSMIIFPFVFLHDTFAREHERKTLDLLQLTDLSDGQIVWGKYLSSIVIGSLSLLISIPVFMSCQLLGGVDMMSIIGIILIAEVLLIASSNCAIFAATNYFHSRIERLLIWLKSYFLLAISYFVICTFSSILIGSLTAFPLIIAAGIAALLFHIYISVRESSDRLHVAETDYLEWKGPVKKRDLKRKHIRLVDIEQKPIIEFAMAFPLSGMKFIWLLVGMSLITGFEFKWPNGELPRAIFSISTRIWVLLTPLLCSNLLQRNRPGIWDDLLIAPLSNEELLWKYLRFGLASFLSFWIPVVAVTSLIVPISSWLLVPQMLVLLSLAVWAAVTSWLASLSNQSRRMAVWGPTTFVFVLLIAVPLIGTSNQPTRDFPIPFLFSMESIAAAVACIWTLRRPSSTAITMCSISLLFLSASITGVLLNTSHSLTNDPFLLLDPFYRITNQRGHDMGDIVISAFRPALAVGLTCFILILIAFRTFDRLTERVEQKSK